MEVILLVNYFVFKNEAKKSEAHGNGKYGICACIFSGGLLDIVKCVYDISDNIVWLRALADKLNQQRVEPIQMCEIIEDELFLAKA